MSLEAQSLPAWFRAPAAQRPRRRPSVRFDPLLAERTPGQRQTRTILVVVSIVAHALLATALALFPGAEKTLAGPTLPIAITFRIPAPEIRETFRPPPPPKERRAPRPAPPPEVRRPPEPEIEAPPPVAKPEPPPPVATREPPPPVVAPPRVRPTVRTGLLEQPGEGPARPPTAAPRTLAAVNGFAIPSPGAASPGPERRSVAVTAFGNGASPASPEPARKRTAGTVRPTAFGSEGERPERPAAPPRSERKMSSLDGYVEILSKPKPVYTNEARRLKIEGDVLLEVTFTASERVLVVRVLEGLGHGLDEAAIDAAKKIRFVPARRDGRPVDTTTTLRVVFRLA